IPHDTISWKNMCYWRCIVLIVFLDEALMSFRGCFFRNHAFNWFVIAIMGFIVRGDSLGITSFIRELNLDLKFYVTFLHFFRSSAWNLETLTKHWINLVTKSVEIQKVDGMNILIADGVKQTGIHFRTHVWSCRDFSRY